MEQIENKIKDLKLKIADKKISTILTLNKVEVVKQEIDLFLEQEDFVENLCLIMIDSFVIDSSHFFNKGEINNININLNSAFYHDYLPKEFVALMDQIKMTENRIRYIFKTGAVRIKAHSVDFRSVFLNDYYLMQIVNPCLLKYGLSLKHTYLSGDQKEDSDLDFTYDLILI